MNFQKKISLTLLYSVQYSIKHFQELLYVYRVQNKTKNIVREILKIKLNFITFLHIFCIILSYLLNTEQSYM